MNTEHPAAVLRSRRLRRRIVIRLLIAWFVLSGTLGPLAYFLEQRRLDDYLFGQARAAAARLGATATQVLETRHQTLRRTMEEESLAGTRFVGIQLYSKDRDLVSEIWLKDHIEVKDALLSHVHEFPPLGRHHHNKFWSGDTLYIETVIPLGTPDKRISGYFEGIYHVDPAMVVAGAKRVRDALIVVIVVVSVTTLVLYPVIVSLNRETLQLSEELLRANLDLMQTLGSAIAKRDSDTGLHNHRVTLYAIWLAEAASIEAKGIRKLVVGAFLHDVGKIAISDAILRKPGLLTEDEFESIKTHVGHGIDIVAESAWLAGATEVVAFHHEKVDGSGYPRGIGGESIPINARIFAIADVFDALTSERPYKRAIGLEDALQTMREGRAKHFDPDLLDRFLAVAPELYRQIATADELSLRASLRSLVGRYW